jgi:hypothetical protein
LLVSSHGLGPGYGFCMMARLALLVDQQAQ